MEIANIIIALLALIVAVLAIIVSVRQAIKSDNIALLGLRIEFYNYLCEFMQKYSILAEFEQMKNSKNPPKQLFPQGENTPIIQTIFFYLGNGNIALVFRNITNDFNYLDINKYLFNGEIIISIDKIISKLKEFKAILSESFGGKKSEKQLQEVLVSLKEILNNASQDLMEKIKTVIAIKNKI